jgi:N-acetylglucosaminyl-diphospho-decaprenol L-rhamnosyltransferase
MMATARALPEPVDVLIVNYATPELTLRALRSARGPQVRFWVRDNSGDLGEAEARRAAGTSPIDLRAAGGNVLYAAGNNELFALGSANYVLLMNPDVELGYCALLDLQHALDSDATTWAVVPKLLNEDGSAQDYYRTLPSLATMLCDRVPPLRKLLRRTWDEHVYSGQSTDVRRVLEAPPAACMLLKREVVGSKLFDETYSLFFNDTDLCRRMAGRGLRAEVVPEATARHVRGASLARAREADRFIVARIYDENLLAYARRNIRGWRLLWCVVALRRLAERLMKAADKY